MVGYITFARGAAQRLSEKWRHFVCALTYMYCCHHFLYQCLIAAMEVK